MITKEPGKLTPLTKQMNFYIVTYCYVQQMGEKQFDHNSQLIVLTMISVALREPVAVKSMVF